MIKKTLITAITLVLLVTSVAGASAATGDLLGFVYENLTLYYISGLDYDGTRLIISPTNSPVIWFRDITGADLGSLQLKNPDGTNVPLNQGPQAIAYNAVDKMLYGSGMGIPDLYKIDLSTGVKTVVKANVIPIEGSSTVVAGMAWNPKDNTLWMAELNSCTVYHLDLNGNPLGTFNGCGATGSGVVSLGFSPDGTMAYGAFNGYIYILDITTSPAIVEATIYNPSGKAMDLLVCGPKFTKPDGTIVDTLLSQHPTGSTASTGGWSGIEGSNPSPSPSPSPLMPNHFNIFELPNGWCNLSSGKPTVGAITVSADVLQLGAAVTARASFTNPDATDTHTAHWNWGDGSTSPGVVTESGGSGSVDGSHTYAAAGVYAVSLTVTDDDNFARQALYQYVVVYNPASGFVTGAGWINSPAGAYVADPSLAGRANFGFVSKYVRGAAMPEGQTAFRFRAADFNFESDVYDWLVVAGAKAQFKGAGTVNGVPGYSFMLTLTDGEINGGGGVDKLRIKIWNASGEVYDNLIGAPDDLSSANPQEIGAGNIVVHP